jgi:hypothetical protein
MPLCRFTRYQNYRPTNRRRGAIGGRDNIEVEILVVNRTPSHGIRVRKYEAELSEVLVPLGGARHLIGVKHIASDVIDIDAPTTAGGQTYIISISARSHSSQAALGMRPCKVFRPNLTNNRGQRRVSSKARHSSPQPKPDCRDA